MEGSGRDCKELASRDEEHTRLSSRLQTWLQKGLLRLKYEGLDRPAMKKKISVDKLPIYIS